MPGASESQRGKAKVTWTGIGEVINYETKGNAPFIHRRIIFAAPNALADAELLFKAAAGGGYFRSVVKETSDLPLGVINSLFTEARGKDWTNELVAKVETKNVELLSDVTEYVQGGSDAGKVKKTRKYLEINREMEYADAGGVSGGSPWASQTSALGNVYVLDIFSNRESDEDAAAGVVSTELTVYWSE